MSWACSRTNRPPSRSSRHHHHICAISVFYHLCTIMELSIHKFTNKFFIGDPVLKKRREMPLIPWINVCMYVYDSIIIVSNSCRRQYSMDGNRIRMQKKKEKKKMHPSS